MTDQPEADHRRLESVYQSMLTALAGRNIAFLDTLLADDVELRSYAIGLETLRGKADVLEAVKVTRDQVFDPGLLSYEHLGNGWLIGAGTLRHSTRGGWVADSSKAALARVVGTKVHASLASPTVADARAEFAARASGEAERP